MLFRRDERPYTSDDELRGDAHRSTNGGLFGFLKKRASDNDRMTPQEYRQMRNAGRQRRQRRQS